MTPSHDFQLFFQTVTLFMAIYFTFTYISVALAFVVKGINKISAGINAGQALAPAFFWALFFWLMKAQF